MPLMDIRSKKGITLLELMIATGLVALIVTATCGVYFYAVSMWERCHAMNSAYSTAVIAMDTIQHYLENGTGTPQIINNGHGIIINFPGSQLPSGEYIPSRSVSPNIMNIGYQTLAAKRKKLYMSNGDGITTSGNILWLANTNPTNSNIYIPDRDWSLLKETGDGRIAPIESLTFEIRQLQQDSFWDIESGCLVEVTIVTCGKSRDRDYRFTLKRSIRERNTNPYINRTDNPGF